MVIPMPEHQKLTQNDTRTLVEEGTFDYTMGDEAEAIRKLTRATQLDPECFEAWHALAEVHFSLRQLDEALAAGEKALVLRPEDIHIHTSLSRIHMERGDKTTAEHHGAQARMLGWKDQLKQPPGEKDGTV